MVNIPGWYASSAAFIVFFHTDLPTLSIRSLSTLPLSRPSRAAPPKPLKRPDRFIIENKLLLTSSFKLCIGLVNSYLENSELVSAASLMIPKNTA